MANNEQDFESKLWDLVCNIADEINKLIEKHRGWLHTRKIYISVNETGCAWMFEGQPKDRKEVPMLAAMRIKEKAEETLTGLAVVHDEIVVDTSRAEGPERFSITLQWLEKVPDGRLTRVSVS